MANIGEHGRIPVLQLYNMIPTGGVAGTARVVLVDGAGVTVAEVAAATVSIAASNLYTVLLAATSQAIMDKAIGGIIYPSVETRYNTSGHVAGVPNVAPTTSSPEVWSASVGYYFGVINAR